MGSSSNKFPYFSSHPLIFLLSMLLLLNNIHASTKMSISYSTTMSSSGGHTCTNESTISECGEGAGMEMESEISRRFLAEGRMIGYGSLKPDQPACNGGKPGASYSELAMESRERSKRRKRKAESIRGEEDFITVYGHHIMVYLICNYKDEIEQEKIKDVAKKKKNKKINNNNNNSLVHVLDEDDRGPPMPDQMARKIKEMMDMNDGKEDDNNNESFMKRRMVWLGQKKIEVTDTSTHHNRLFFPKGTTEKLTAFCSDEENRAIRVTENSKNKKDDDQGTEAGDAPGQGLYVQVVDGEGGVWEKAMLLKWWQSVKKTVFTREWNSYVKERRLKPEVLSLQLWCFRDAQNKLCFAVNVVPTATTPPNVASGNKDQSNADVANGSDNNGCDQTNNVSGASDQTNNLNGEEGGTPVLVANT